MYKVSVSVPAVCTNVGPGYDTLGLALNMRNVIEMSLTTDDQLMVQVRGEGADALPNNYYNPVMEAAIALFQQLEQAPVGLSVASTNHIPLDVGLSARDAMPVGGLVAANVLLGSPYQREDLIGLATEIGGRPEAVITAMRGGLGICTTTRDGLIYRAIEITPLRVVIAVPTLPAYKAMLRDDLPGVVPMNDAVFNMGHTALLIEALRSGDFKLLRQVIQDHLHEPYRIEHIPGYKKVVAAAEEAGAIAVTLCGAGPALMVFASFNHQHIESAIQAAFRAVDVEAKTWSVGVDMQGVVISVVQ